MSTENRDLRINVNILKKVGMYIVWYYVVMWPMWAMSSTSKRKVNESVNELFQMIENRKIYFPTCCDVGM